jgi:glycosyltransferase involved in cell wall biosynthesis
VRVLHVIQQLNPGGAETVALSLIAGLQERGIASAVAAAPGTWSQRYPVPTYELPLLHRRPSRLPASALRLARAVAAFRPDVVHCHNPAMAAAASLPTLRGRRPPALVTVHGVPEQDYASTAAVLRISGLRVVSCGPGVTAALRDHGVQVSATVVNGVAPPPPPAARVQLVGEYDLLHMDSLVVSVGRLQPQKRHDVAIRAVAQVPRAALIVVGEGPERSSLEALVATLGVTDRVRLIGTSRHARQMMAAADALLLTSDWEGLPLVLVESMMSGVPVVATAARGVRELLRNGKDAVLCPVGDIAAVAAGLDRVLGDKHFGDRLAAAAAGAAAHYTERAMVDAYLQLYRDAGR